MIYIFDRNENLLEIITEYKEFIYTKKLNSDRSLKFEIEKNNNIKKYNKVGFFDTDKNFQLFFIDDITSFKDNKTEKISVDCLADFFNLGNTLIDDKRASTLQDAAIKCLEDTDYKVGIVESFEDRNINFYHISRIKALNEIINTFKCEIDIRVEIDAATGRIGNKYIDFKHRLGTDTGIRFTYDTALESVEKTTLEGHFNVLWGWGKSLETENGGFSRKLDFADINDGKKYVEDTESIKKYGRLEGIFEDSKIEDKTILLKATKERLAEVKELKMSYKANIKDISKLSGYGHFRVNLGDTIIILDEEIDDIIEARIIGIEESKEDQKTESDVELTLGNFLPALSDEDLNDILGNLNDKIDNIPKPDIPTADTIFPNTLPNIPIVEAQGLFSSVVLAWTYENKTHYTYEVFASKIKDFMPSHDNRIFEGKASSYLHEVKPSETWYYRVRGKNSYGKVTDYSTQVEATTKKISDGTQYFEELAIGHALIASLDLDKATVGKLTAQFLDVYNLVVKDGNDNVTLRVDDFGRIYMNVTELKISSKSVETQDGALAKIQDAINEYNKLIDKEFDDVINAYVDLETEMNTSFKDGLVSKSEAISINERLVALEKEKEDIYKEYNTIYSNSNLNDTTEKTELLNTKTNLDIAYLELKNSILNTIEDSKITDAELLEINNKTTAYNTTSANYKEAFTRAIDKVGSVKVNIVNDKANVISQSLTEFKQSSEDFQFKVENRGSVNLLRDAGFIQKTGNGYNGDIFEHWGHYAYATDAGQNIISLLQVGYSNEWAYKDPLTNTIVIKDKNNYNTQSDRTEMTIYQYVDLVVGKTYTMSFNYAGHRVNRIIFGCRGTSSHADDWVVRQGTSNIPSGGADINNWGSTSFTFTCERARTRIEMGILGRSEADPYMWISRPMLTEGLQAVQFTTNNKEIIGNTMIVNQNDLSCNFENGTKTSMGRDGFYYKTGDGQWEYHALSTVGTIRIPSEETRIITLPAVFRNKNFKVICTVSQIGSGNDAISNPKPLISFWAGSDQHNIANGTFRIYGSTRLRNDNGTVAYRDKVVEVSYTVVA